MEQQLALDLVIILLPREFAMADEMDDVVGTAFDPAREDPLVEPFGGDVREHFDLDQAGVEQRLEAMTDPLLFIRDRQRRRTRRLRLDDQHAQARAPLDRLRRHAVKTLRTKWISSVARYFRRSGS